MTGIDLDSLRDKDRQEAARWISIIEEFEAYAQASGRKKRSKAARDFIQSYRMRNPDEKICWGTLHAKIKAFRERGPIGLVNPCCKVNKSVQWPEEAKAFLRQLYLHINAPHASWCIKQLRMEAVKRSWDLPSDRTLRRFLDDIPEETKAFYRKGKKYWRENHVPSVLRSYSSIRPGQIYVSDHAQINVAVRHPSGKILFPWFTGWMDMRTRRIVGKHLAETPSSDTINISLLDALKENCPEHTIIDNGRDFSSHHFSGQANKRRRFKFSQDEQDGIYRLLGIEPHFCIPGNPQAKPIERWFWTQEMDFQKAFLTYRGNNIRNRPEGVDARIRDEQGVLEWNEFVSCLIDFIAQYNNSSHRGDGMNGRTPNEVWNEHFASNPLKQLAPSSIRLLMMKSSNPVKVGRFGIEAFRTFYRSDQLMEKQGQLVLYKYNPEDLSELHVYSLKWEYICSCQKVHRTAWNDENAYKEIKHFEKKRRKALEEARKADEAMIQVEYGYRKHNKEENPKKKAEIVSLVKTPFDGVQKKIDREKSGSEKAEVVQGIFSFEPKKEEPDEREKLRKEFMPRLTINERPIHD